jgi:hypothetical protein
MLFRWTEPCLGEGSVPVTQYLLSDIHGNAYLALQKGQLNSFPLVLNVQRPRTTKEEYEQLGCEPEMEWQASDCSSQWLPLAEVVHTSQFN